jgi:hypothetical protein
MLVTLKGVRLAFADIWAPKPPGTARASQVRLRLIVDPKNNKDDGEADPRHPQEGGQGEVEGQGRRRPGVIEGDNQKYCWFEEDKLNAEGDVVDGFEGMFYLSCPVAGPAHPDRPRPHRAVQARTAAPTPAAIVVSKVDIWAQDNAHGKGMRAQIQGLQFMRDGDAFGGGTRSKVDDFEDLSDLGGRGRSAPGPRKRPRGPRKTSRRPVASPPLVALRRTTKTTSAKAMTRRPGRE